MNELLVVLAVCGWITILAVSQMYGRNYVKLVGFFFGAVMTVAGVGGLLVLAIIRLARSYV